jgi:hypothetical protein
MVAGDSSSVEKRDSAREPTGCPLGDVALHQDLEQVLRAFAEHGPILQKTIHDLIAAMPPAFKTVAVVGKSDATSLPDVLDQLSRVLRKRGLAILMDPLTAGRLAPASRRHRSP